MKSVLLRLREMKDHMSSTEAEIAKYIIMNPSEVLEMSVRELATKTFSSPSSVVRACNDAGFSGYKELQQALMIELATLGDDLSHQEESLTPKDSIDDIIHKITKKNIQSLQDSEHLLDPESVRKSVDLIHQAHNILLFGIGSSLCICRDTYLKFLRVNKPCVFNDDWHNQLLQARNSTKNDVAIIISYSGETKECIQCMETLIKNGTPCIAITRYAPSSVAKLATYNLYTAANETIFRNGAMTSRSSQLNVIDILYTAFLNKDYDNNIKRLAYTHILKEDIAHFEDDNKQ